MNHNSVPMIRLELEGMALQLRHAFSAYQVQMDAQVQAALDAYCTPECVQHVIDETVERTLTQVIREEVARFFTHGDGRQTIRRAVEQRLANNETSTPLDIP
jgi:hypothetical protein